MASTCLSNGRELGLISQGTQRKMMMMPFINDEDGEDPLIYIIRTEVLLGIRHYSVYELTQSFQESL